MRARLAAALLAAIAAGAIVAHPSAQEPSFTAADLTGSPYRHPGHSAHRADGRYHEALAAIAEKAGDFPRAARQYAVACQVDAQSARDLSMSAPTCTRARALADQHNVRDARIQLLLATGTMRAWSFNFPGAVATLKEAIALGEGLDPDHPDSAPLIGAHQMLGSALVELGQFDAARTSLIFGRDHCRTTGNATCAAYADIWLCRLNAMLGNFTEARAACNAARAEAAVDNDRLVYANLGWMEGTLEAMLRRPGASLTALQGAWEAASAPEAELLRPIIAQLIVDALVRLGRLNEAETWQRGLDEGLANGTVPFFFGPQIAMRRGQIAAVRGRLDDAEAAFATGARSLIYEMSIRGHVGVARINRYQRKFPEARAALERAIARIERGRTAVGGSALRSSYLGMHASAYRELVGVRWDSDGQNAAPAILELAEAGRARALVDTLASAQVAGEQALTLEAAAVQARLTADEVLVEYVSSDERLIAVTVTPDRITVTPLERAGNAEDLARRVDFFATMAQETDEVAMAPSARRLYADLLAPALEGVPDSARTLIIAADGPLHGLPFDALGDSTRVIDRWNVVMVPSASALAGRTRDGAPTAPALVVAAHATEPGLTPLAAAPAEAAAIRSRVGGRIAELSGAGATRARLDASQLDRFAVLHFASHALVNEELPLQSALVLADGGRWSAEEIYRSKLRADLVVLSACSTAAGAAAPGEGVMSLSRAFLHAGAAATVATLWDVPDAPSPAFADVLYRELSRGRPLGVAAADARRELRRQGAPPRAWAAYVLTGNPGVVASLTPRTPPRAIAARLIAVVAIVLLLAALAARAARRPWRVNWAQLATAGALFAAAAVTLQWWPAQDTITAGMTLASRGPSDAAITPLVAGKVITWPSVTGADEHVVELFDEAGQPAGPERVAASPFTLPATPEASWIRVLARRGGQDLAHSALMRIGQ
jgi:CHAT domain-containing protein